MQRLWYSFLRIYVRIGLRFFYKTIAIQGRSNIPEGPVIFAANHQNAFMDALLIVCFNSHITHFLTRADIFKKPLFNWLLSTLNMIPVYRIRDGWASLAENQKTFEACNKLFLKDEAVVIFPEGNHGEWRRLRPISKGFARVAFESLQRNPDLKISIVPVGLNYSNHQAFRESVSVIFGKPILANDYYKTETPSDPNGLRDELETRMKQLITHVENPGRYPEVIQNLELTRPNYLDPLETNQRIGEIEKGNVVVASPSRMSKNTLFDHLLHLLAVLINFIPLQIWRTSRRRIKDPVFVASMKFGIGIFLFPIYYLLMAIPFYLLWGMPAVVIWLVVSFLSMLFFSRSV